MPTSTIRCLFGEELQRMSEASPALLSYAIELSANDHDLARFPQRAFEFTHAGTVLIDQDFGDVGSIVWDAEVVLAHHLDATVSKSLRGMSVLELGAGTGLAGIVAARLGAHVVLTDQAKLLPQLQRNADANLTGEQSSATGTVTVTEVLWSADPADLAALSTATHRGTPFLHHFDLVIGADIVYSDAMQQRCIAMHLWVTDSHGKVGHMTVGRQRAVMLNSDSTIADDLMQVSAQESPSPQYVQSRARPRCGVWPQRRDTTGGGGDSSGGGQVTAARRYHHGAERCDCSPLFCWWAGLRVAGPSHHVADTRQGQTGHCYEHAHRRRIQLAQLGGPARHAALLKLNFQAPPVPFQGLLRDSSYIAAERDVV
ncbi:putative methyltransferase-domain-containing protein [Tribonema minus]|uniref:Putative methyltransferase-domain-containing protein n=1 Tax=Tribonema minus TaxID=303371 RepID=A0A836CAM0_9STRA|nr:putative methyltransferase-domain-containing protein [Tribonema minus]